MSIKHLIFSGGGPNGILQLGILYECVRSGFVKYDDIISVCGSSAGAILAVTVGLKLPVQQVVDYIVQRPWNKFIEINYATINEMCGVAPCERLGEAMAPLLLANDISPEITFKDAYERTGIEIHIIVTNVDHFDSVSLNWKTFPDMPVLKGMSFSSALPPLFSPGTYQDKWYLDGGLSNNFPYNIRVKDLGSPEGIMAVNLVGSVNSFKPPMSLTDHLFFLFNQIILKVIRHSENHESALATCPLYIVVPVTSMTEPELWKEIIFVEEGRQSLIEKGVHVAVEFFGKKSLEGDNSQIM
jgi:predicted acylesterase/phospholipase RssA